MTWERFERNMGAMVLSVLMCGLTWAAAAAAAWSGPVPRVDPLTRRLVWGTALFAALAVVFICLAWVGWAEARYLYRETAKKLEDAETAPGARESA